MRLRAESISFIVVGGVTAIRWSNLARLMPRIARHTATHGRLIPSTTGMEMLAGDGRRDADNGTTGMRSVDA